MPLGKINFVGVKTEFEPIPAGTYQCAFKDFAPGKVQSGKNVGEDKIDLIFQVTEDGDWHGRKLYRTCTFTKESLWAFKRTMSALGAEPDWESDDGVDVEEIARSVLDNPCLVKVSQREYTPEGETTPRTQNQIDDVKPASSSLEAEVDEVPAPARSRR